MVREYTASKHTKRVYCSVCNRKIDAGEKYYKIGRSNNSYGNGRNKMHKITNHPTKHRGITTYCSDCVDGIYVDGSKTKSMESLTKIEVIVNG